MRGNRIPTRAKRRIRNDHRTTATDEFEHRILIDCVFDDVVEDQQLAMLEESIARLEDARDQRRDDLAEPDVGSCSDLATAVEAMHDPPRARVMEICAERCRTVLIDGDDWVERGWEDAEEMATAKREAATWLLEHPDVRARLWGSDEDAELDQLLAAEADV